MNQKKIVSDNVFFDDLSLTEAAQSIRRLSQAKEFSYVVTPNVDHLARISGGNADPNLKAIYRNADLSLCDSRILEKMLKAKGKHIKEVVPGSTLTEYLFQNTITSDDCILVVGVEEHYIEKLRQQYPNFKIEHINPSMGFINREDEVVSLLENIKLIDANYIFLSVGSPRQEILAQRMKYENNLGGVALCVGASILFMVGAETRAPVILQKMHLEWAYRMLQDPGRLLSRYFKNFLTLPVIFKHL